jgi:hypothetical protein
LLTSLAKCTPSRATHGRATTSKTKNKKLNVRINILDEGKPTYNEGIA